MGPIGQSEQFVSYLQLKGVELGLSSVCYGCLSISCGHLLSLQSCICLCFACLISATHLLHISQHMRLTCRVYRVDASIGT